jgi:hypothetical protein
MKKIVKFEQDEFLNQIEIFDLCQDIFLTKFVLEDGYDLDGYSDLSFYVQYLDEKIIGFGSLQSSIFYTIDITLLEDFEFSDIHLELLNHILNDCLEEKSVYLYQAREIDSNFYLKNGFELYKDYGQFFPEGLDKTRFILEKI